MDKIARIKTYDRRGELIRPGMKHERDRFPFTLSYWREDEYGEIYLDGSEQFETQSEMTKWIQATQRNNPGVVVE